jgi:hypothetical protein
MMKGRTVLLFVALALVTALGFYAGISTSTPRAAADAQVDPPASSEGSAQPDGATGRASPSRGAGTRDPAVKASRPKDPATDASASGNGGSQAGPGTQPARTPAKPPASAPQPAGPVRFGPMATAGNPSELDIAGDRRALTVSFWDFEVTVEPASAEPDATKSFSMTVPLTAGAEGETLRVHAQGFAFMDEGAKASVTLQGGGRQVIKGFATGDDDSFLQTLELPARPGVTYQLHFAIAVDRGATAEGVGYLNIAAIDMEIR